MAKCSKCRGDNCESCGQPVVCTSHCYCQAIKIGSTDHVVCCKCGDRTASLSWRPWPQPSIPYYPQPYTWPTWQPNIITYGVTNQTNGRYTILATNTIPEVPLSFNPDDFPID